MGSATNVETEKDQDRGLPDAYPFELSFDATSVEQFHFRVRAILPDDGKALITFHDHLSDRSCYLRFFSLHRHLSLKEVERFTRVDYRDRLALVAEHDGRLIAVGRYDRRPGSTEAEVAFVVADECQHHGIGSFLLDCLAEAARARGIATFVADTLEENLTMLRVFTHSGFPITRHCEYGTVAMRFSIALNPSYETRRARRRAGWEIVGSGPSRARQVASPAGEG
jgi:GNAT superfamily N-acetyltransferase